MFNGTAHISDEEYPNPDRVFLSKLTGILAFKKLTRMGAIIEIKIGSGYISCELIYGLRFSVCPERSNEIFAFCISDLNHLRPFVKFANDLANSPCPLQDSGKTSAKGKTVQRCSVGTQCTLPSPQTPSPVYLPANVSYVLISFLILYLSHLWILSKLLAFF